MTDSANPVGRRRPTVALLGAFDTKGVEFRHVQGLIERRGFDVFVIDTSVVGSGYEAPAVSPSEVARAGGRDLAELIQLHDRGEAVAAMTGGAAVVAKEQWQAGRFDAILSLGGGAGTVVGTAAMRALPFGVPKVMVSTLAGGDVAAYVGGSDIVMLPSVVDISGINRITRGVFAGAVGAVCGMLEARRQLDAEEPPAERPLIAATMFGTTTRAVDHARQLLEAEGFEVLVFHATGTGGAAMENLIRAGQFEGVLDLTTTELADELCGGVLSAGPERLRGAGLTGTPQVVAPGCLDMVNFWAMETVPEKYRERALYAWNPNVTLMRTTVEENRRLAATVAARLNAATGPTAVFVPGGGFSELDVTGGEFWLPEADGAFVAELTAALRPDIPVTILDVDVNAPSFAEAMAAELIAMVRAQNHDRP